MSEAAGGCGGGGGAITVLVADDEELVRDGLVAIIGAAPDLSVAGVAHDGAEAVAQVARLHPDVVLMDVRMPRMDGIEATRRIVASSVTTRVLVLTTFETDEVVIEALRAGVSGFLLKSSPRERLYAGIRAVVDGEALLAPSVTRRLIQEYVAGPPRPTRAPMRLTSRQTDVVRLVASGLSNGEIAARLHLAPATVKGYVSDVLLGHGLRDRAQLVVLAYESGLVSPGRGPETGGPKA